jgi:DNA (cytosine-5)-methyltransferase 1
VVLGDLADLGYDARWGVLGAHHVGAPHKRHRLWIVAHTSSRWSSGWDKSGLCGAQLANTNSAWEPQSQGGIQEQRGRIGYGGENVEHSDLPRQEWTERSQEGPQCSGRGMPHAASWWDSEPNVGRVAHGVARRVDRLRALGNGQVPAVAALAWRMLSADLSGIYG